MVRAGKIFDEWVILADGARLALRLWLLPSPLPPSTHRFRYALFYGRPGQVLVLFDHERGKGDHKHIREQQAPYRFVSPERLIADFWAAVRAIQAEEAG